MARTKHPNVKTLTKERLSIDIRTMQADTRTAGPKFLRWRNGASATVSFRDGMATVEMRVSGQAANIATVWLDTTPLNFGGYRVWWICPHCNERAGLLYWQAQRWQCRKCAGLLHESTRQGDDSLAFARVNKIRHKLGWGGGLLSPMGGKPRRMHWSTYHRLMLALMDASERAAHASAEVADRFCKRVGRRTDG